MYFPVWALCVLLFSVFFPNHLLFRFIVIVLRCKSQLSSLLRPQNPPDLLVVWSVSVFSAKLRRAKFHNDQSPWRAIISLWQVRTEYVKSLSYHRNPGTLGQALLFWWGWLGQTKETRRVSHFELYSVTLQGSHTEVQTREMHTATCNIAAWPRPGPHKEPKSLSEREVGGSKKSEDMKSKWKNKFICDFVLLLFVLVLSLLVECHSACTFYARITS
jgi:hypothetical protein